MERFVKIVASVTATTMILILKGGQTLKSKFFGILKQLLKWLQRDSNPQPQFVNEQSAI